MIELLSAIDFENTVRQWITQQGEVVILLDHIFTSPIPYLCLRFEPLMEDISKLNLIPGSTIIALKEYDLPVRGVVDDAFIHKAIAMLPQETECILMLPDIKGNFHYEKHLETSAEFLEEIDKYRGQIAVFGKFPWYEYLGNGLIQVEAKLPWLAAEGSI